MTSLQLTADPRTKCPRLMTMIMILSRRPSRALPDRLEAGRSDRLRWVLLTVLWGFAPTLLAGTDTTLSVQRPTSSPQVSSAESVTAQLQAIEGMQRGNFAGAVATLDALALRRSAMAAAEREYFDYLAGWQATFRGDYDGGLALLRPLADAASDPVVRTRAMSTAIGAYNMSRRYPEAFALLLELSNELEQVSDGGARAQALGNIAMLYSHTGQPEVARRYAQKLLDESAVPWARCGAQWLNLDAAWRGQRLELGADAIGALAQNCSAPQTWYFASGIRLIQARLLSNAGDHAAADAILRNQRPVIEREQLALLLAQYDGAQARNNLRWGRPATAREYALAVIDRGGQDEFSEAIIEAWAVRYEIAKAQGDWRAALDYHERYLEVQRAFFDDAAARVLAFEMANHQAAAAQLEIAALQQRNQVLALERELSAAEAARGWLWIAVGSLLLASLLALTWRIRRSQLKFRRQAQHDALTGVASRQNFLDQAARRLARARAATQPQTLLLLDLDHFKSINEARGHLGGDQALRRVADACTSALPADALFGRLGGEEFAVLWPAPDAAAAVALAERLRVAIADLPEDQQDGLQVTASFGVSITAQAGYELRELLIQADHALFSAKRSGRNRVHCYQADPAPAA